MTTWPMISFSTQSQPTYGLANIRKPLTKSEIEREEIRKWEAELAGKEYASKCHGNCQGGGLQHIRSLVNF